MATFSETVERVSSSAAEVLRLLRQEQLPEPTFEEAGVHDFDSRKYASADAEALRQARNALINAAQDLSHLTMGPVDYLCSLSWSASKIANLGSLVRLDIPRRIPQGGSRSLSDLVAEIGLPELITSRVIRYAIANGLLHEEPIGIISHSAASARLAIDRNMHNYCLMWSSEISSLLVKLPEALARKQAYGDKAPEAAANLAFPEYMSLFDYFEKRTDAAQRYSTYLASRAQIPCWSADYLVKAWDWSSIGSGTVVDVGGSAGLTSVILAQAYPSIHIVNQDLSLEALKEGEAEIKKLGLDFRISFAHHDFFTPQTVSAKAYIFKSILHDWSDEACVKIIRALLPALADDAHVLVAECLMPHPPALRASAWEYEAKRVEDQIMIAGHAAHERSLEQFKAIFFAASQNFHFNGVKEDVDGTVFSLIDFAYRTGEIPKL
ncbi:putative O-methyltransferase [Xylogone sp. PMI_703]|nr:putative O-methyltransferase [Xylogone sp. PMI_703]